MTCKNIRGCKLWRVTESDPKNRLSWCLETPGGHESESLTYIHMIEFWVQSESLTYIHMIIQVTSIFCGSA